FTFSAGVSDAAANPARFGQTWQLDTFLGIGGRDFGPAGMVLQMAAADPDVTGVDDALVGGAQSGQVSVESFTYTPVAGKRVPAGPHNSYDSGAWLTPAGYDRLFRGTHYAFKFHLAAVALRRGADAQAVAHRLNAKAAAIKGGHNFAFGVTPPPPILQAVKDVAALPLALSAFLAVLAVGAVGHALSIAVRRRRHELAVLRALRPTPPPPPPA